MQLTVRDVSRLLQVSEKTVYRWIEQGKLPSFKINDQYRFNRAELLEWASANRINFSAELCAEPETVTAETPTFASALREGGIHYRVGGHDKPSVLKNLVEVMRLPEEVNREFLLRVLLAREALQSTGIGDGIAIPHPRSPIVMHIRRPMITLCFLERPIDFGALDGLPVRVLFSLTSPSARAHLQLLSRVAFALQDSQFKALITKEASRDEILADAERIDASISQRPKPEDGSSA